jgi:hypothetical protein
LAVKKSESALKKLACVQAKLGQLTKSNQALSKELGDEAGRNKARHEETLSQLEAQKAHTQRMEDERRERDEQYAREQKDRDEQRAREQRESMQSFKQDIMAVFQQLSGNKDGNPR